MRMKLVIAADVDRTLLDRVGADPRFEVAIRPCRTEADLALAAADAEIVVTRAYNAVTRRVVEGAPRLRLVAQGTSGIDNIDLEALAARGVEVIHLPGENANAVAELLAGWMIALTRTVPAYTRSMVAGAWTRDDCATRHELRHYRLGIVGLGNVGGRVAGLAAAFGMRTVAFDPYLTDADFAARGAGRANTLEELLARSDILTLHVPLTPESRGMIGAAQVAALPRGAMLLNTSRGEVLDAAAALEALATGHLGGLALDVYDPEPPSRTFPDDPRLIVTPHIAGCSFEAKAAIGAKLYEKIVEWLGKQ